jgi:hypothetical protein
VAHDAGDAREYLLITDQLGNCFAIPRDVVVRFSLKAAQKAELEQILDEDLSGRSCVFQYLNERRIDAYQSERRCEAQSQVVSLRPEAPIDRCGPVDHYPGQIFMGMFRYLPLTCSRTCS